MASLSIANASNSTTTGDPVYFDPPVRTLTAQASGSPLGTTGLTGTFSVEGSLDGTNWTTIISGTTFADTATATSTSANLIAVARAKLTALSTGDAASVFVTGK